MRQHAPRIYVGELAKAALRRSRYTLDTHEQVSVCGSMRSVCGSMRSVCGSMRSATEEQVHARIAYTSTVLHIYSVQGTL